MESEKYPLLFSPIKVGTQTVRNRVFMPPISTNLADHGYVTDALVDHYAARAKGGVGLIVTEVVTVEPTYIYLPGDMCMADDSYIPGWEKLAAAVHEHGAKILPQLFHPAYMAFLCRERRSSSPRRSWVPTTRARPRAPSRSTRSRSLSDSSATRPSV